jgi:type IV secretory pathway VirB9-like protein
MRNQWKTVSVLAAIGVSAIVAQPLAGQATGIREVSASERSLIPLQTRLRYTTMIVLPETEEILDVICGDRDWWVITATNNIAHVKPAKASAETNLNLVTASGAIYSFLISERNGGGTPDLKVYVTGLATETNGKRRYYSAAHVEELEAQLTQARTALEGAARRAEEEAATFRQQYPTRLDFAYGSPKYERPFLVRSMWHDGQFTYVKSDARELPALYEVKDGKPAVVNFQVQNGTYIVPKVLDRGYLALGNERFTFTLQER